jgi:hypothetical protein
MKDTTKNIIKAVALVLALVLIVSSIFIVRSCSAPPDYEEIRERVEELIEKSFDVNDIVWGNGLPTYPREIAPKRELYESGKTYVDGDGKEQPLNYYYYYVNTSGVSIVAFREQKAVTEDFRYAYVSSSPIDSTTLASLYPIGEGENALEGLYSEVFADTERKIYAYLIPYTEVTSEFYYLESDLTDYGFVRLDSKYKSADEIKEYIRTVYALEYADSLDTVLFDGVMSGDYVQKARYSTIQTSRGSFFARHYDFEPLFTERRVYLYDTARIDRRNSNDSTVVVEFDSYLPSSPDEITLTKVCFALQDGVWYLSSPTY